MIRSFRHKGLRDLYVNGTSAAMRADFDRGLSFNEIAGRHGCSTRHARKLFEGIRRPSCAALAGVIEADGAGPTPRPIADRGLRRRFRPLPAKRA